MAEISDETLAFIVNRAKNIHHGEVRLIINADSPKQVTVEVVEKARFNTDDQVLPPQSPSRPVPGGRSPANTPRRG